MARVATRTLRIIGAGVIVTTCCLGFVPPTTKPAQASFAPNNLYWHHVRMCRRSTNCFPSGGAAGKVPSQVAE